MPTIASCVPRFCAVLLRVVPSLDVVIERKRWLLWTVQRRWWIATGCGFPKIPQDLWRAYDRGRVVFPRALLCEHYNADSNSFTHPLDLQHMHLLSVWFHILCDLNSFWHLRIRSNTTNRFYTFDLDSSLSCSWHCPAWGSKFDRNMIPAGKSCFYKQLVRKNTVF